MQQGVLSTSAVGLGLLLAENPLGSWLCPCQALPCRVHSRVLGALGACWPVLPAQGERSVLGAARGRGSKGWTGHGSRVWRRGEWVWTRAQCSTGPVDTARPELP